LASRRISVAKRSLIDGTIERIAPPVRTHVDVPDGRVVGPDAVLGPVEWRPSACRIAAPESRTDLGGCMRTASPYARTARSGVFAGVGSSTWFAQPACPHPKLSLAIGRRTLREVGAVVAHHRAGPRLERTRRYSIW
jgi:hypothetical protein